MDAMAVKSESKEVKEGKKKLNMGAFSNKNQSQVQEPQKRFLVKQRSNSISSLGSSVQMSQAFYSGEHVK